MEEVRLADTTLRDGPNSLWAQLMRTGMMVPIAEQLDSVGFDSIELDCKPSKKIFRELKEDPWERLRLIHSRVKNTPLRGIGGSLNSFEITPRSVSNLYMKLMAEHGIRQMRMTEPANDVSRAANMVQLARQNGLEPIPNVTFSISPKHTDDYYAKKTKQIASLNVFRICLKDPGGLLTPERMRTLVPRVLENANGKPVELHPHCNTGLGPINAVEGAKLGIRIIHVAIPPLANGTSLPSVYNVAKNLRALGYKTSINEKNVAPITEHFNSVARFEHFPVGAPLEYDYGYYLHQIPGGMMSNLIHQLKQVRMQDRLQEVPDEIVRVRAELGNPIMVTPFSQFVGTQAVMNIILGERYKEVTEQVILYTQGAWGEEAAADIDPNVRDKILDRPRARELSKLPRQEPTIEEIRQKLGGPNLSDEELLIRTVMGKEGVPDIKPYDPSQDYLSARQPVLALIQQLAKRSNRSYVHIQRNGINVTLKKSKVNQAEGTAKESK